MKKYIFLFSLFLIYSLSANLLQGVELEYSTYLGGSDANDRALDVGVDRLMFVYVTGWTGSHNFPTKNAYQISMNAITDGDIFVTQIDSTGSALFYSTYLGGSGDDRGHGIAVDSNYRAYITGVTQSYDFPTYDSGEGCFQPAHSGSYHGYHNEAFITAIDETGSRLLYSTYLGGTGNDTSEDIAIDTNNFVYIVGYTDSRDFPTRDAYQPANSSAAYGVYDAFFTKMTIGGSAMVYSTYLGGTSNDQGTGIAVDDRKVPFITGYTGSNDFPTTPGALMENHNGNYDAFITSFPYYLGPNPLAYSTYLGGGDNDYANSIAVDVGYEAYVTGSTLSEDFPTKAAAYGIVLQPGKSDFSDGFVSRISMTGDFLYYSTYLGGNETESCYDITVDTERQAYVTGTTYSTDFPTRNAYQVNRASLTDAFVSKISLYGSALVYSTYLGGDSYDEGSGIITDSTGAVYVAGYTSSIDFPTNQPFQAKWQGGEDAFVTKITSRQTRSYHTDFNGDGTSDIAIFRDTSGLWAVRGITRSYFGASMDWPEPADYNGDGTTDLGIFRASSGLWAIRGITRVYFGGGYDLPIPGDYNGDGTAVPGIFRASSGLWAIRGITRVYFGGTGDTASPGYYNSDDSLDIGIFRSNPGLWAIRGITRVYFGGSADTAKPGDYNGDGAWEPAVFRASSGLWAVRGITRAYFGSSIDEAIPADYNGDNSDTPGIFRSTSGLWAARGTTRIYFGGVGDIPVTR